MLKPLAAHDNYPAWRSITPKAPRSVQGEPQASKILPSYTVLRNFLDCEIVREKDAKFSTEREGMSLTCVKMSEDVWLTCLTHALSTETEEIMGLLLGDIEVHTLLPLFQFICCFFCFTCIFPLVRVKIVCGFGVCTGSGAGIVEICGIWGLFSERCWNVVLCWVVLD